MDTNAGERIRRALGLPVLAGLLLVLSSCVAVPDDPEKDGRPGAAEEAESEHPLLTGGDGDGVMPASALPADPAVSHQPAGPKPNIPEKTADGTKKGGTCGQGGPVDVPCDSTGGASHGTPTPLDPSPKKDGKEDSEENNC